MKLTSLRILAIQNYRICKNSPRRRSTADDISYSARVSDLVIQRVIGIIGVTRLRPAAIYSSGREIPAARIISLDPLLTHLRLLKSARIYSRASRYTVKEPTVQFFDIARVLVFFPFFGRLCADSNRNSYSEYY